LLLAQFAGASRPKVCLLGLAYKPDVDDCRESPSLELAALLMERGCEVGAYDPVVTHSALPQTSLAEAAAGAQAAVLLVAHSEFRALDLELLASQMERPWLLDTQDLVSPLSAAAVGLEVARLGSPEPVSNLEVFR
jgi:UDP-N-acetyl-D-mannosaminuronate dehydrogenase